MFGRNIIDHQELLMSAIGFTDADLKANRAGRLSERQRQNLFRDQSQSAIKWWAVIGIAGLGVLMGLSSPMWGSLCFPYAAPILFVALPAAFLEQNKIRKVVKQGRVSIMQGILSKRGPQNTLQKNTNPKTTRFIYMEGQRFTVSQGVYEALDDDALYRLYYVEATSFLKGKELKLLAAEWLDEDEVLGHLEDSQSLDEHYEADTRVRRRTTQNRA